MSGSTIFHQGCSSTASSIVAPFCCRQSIFAEVKALRSQLEELALLLPALLVSLLAPLGERELLQPPSVAGW